MLGKRKGRGGGDGRGGGEGKRAQKTGGPSREGEAQEHQDALAISDECSPKKGGHDRRGEAGGVDEVRRA